jgi:protein disulfide-isomerase-like protein
MQPIIALYSQDWTENNMTTLQRVILLCLVIFVVYSSGTVIPLTKSNFDQTIKNGYYFVKFYAPWCGHCRELAPTWEKLSQQQTSGVKIAEVNCEKERELAQKFNIRGYPTLIFFKG